MTKPAFVFDGRNILDYSALRTIGFEITGIGKTKLGKRWRISMFLAKECNLIREAKMKTGKPGIND